MSCPISQPRPYSTAQSCPESPHLNLLLSRPRETVQILSHKTPSDIPGKAVITRLVTLPPNEAIPPRTHNDAAVTDLVFRGACLNQMNDEEPVVYREGETFYELPGCHQVRCEISCEKEGEEAEFFAVMVVE